MKNNPKGYITKPVYFHPRLPRSVDNNIYNKIIFITSKWTPAPITQFDCCGNVVPSFGLHTKTFSFKNHTNIGLFQAIPSCLLLYRLLCLYKAKVITYGPNGYKMVWGIILKHKATKELVKFGEWKGGADIFTKFSSHEDLPESFSKDLLELLNFLVSNQVPHPYDGLLAGSVA